MSTKKISVVIPCLNEEKGIGTCIDKARSALDKLGMPYEIVVSDNGSTDNSVNISLEKGARVVREPKKGYGNAYLTGMDASNGDYIVMADADDTYDLSQIQDFIRPLEEGFDFVMGSRFKGSMLPGSMSWSHRYIGNPILSSILRIFFHTRISDSHCGYRSFTRDAYKRMQLKTTGMEFASEMVVNAIKEKLKITEVPINYYPRKGDSKLESLRDAWRHMRFMLLYAPTYLYLLPGVIFLSIGLLLVVGLSMGTVMLFSRPLLYHFNILGMVLSILGFQIISLGIFSRAFSYLNGFDRFDKKIEGFLKNFHLEKGLISGLALFAAGVCVFIHIFLKWVFSNFGELFEIKSAMLATTLTIIGIQMIFSSFFLSFLILEKRNDGSVRPRNNN
ncbi:MAG TPA: glycosyltransferase family 2 protein [Candidatus Omnitrophota bacterium]|nr:glycosyltransferase family 2 protein [Candidatus Omnitrophota bacterium]HPS20052.1 glycosyltransferase family 2 protein [Candidatus Omnitrophota bacterium]